VSGMAVQLQTVTKRYGALHALDAFSLDIREGEILALLGHNGAGKTTAMKLILGLLPADEGTIQVLGHSPTGAAALNQRRRIGYLPENVSFYDNLTGREALAYFADLKGIGRAARESLLAQVGINHAAHRKVKTYSKGMRQRLGLAQALLGSPKLLLLDEPTTGLDPLATRDFYAMLGALRQQGVTIILSSHVLPGVEQCVNRAAIMDHGRLLACGTLDELRQRAQMPLVIQVRGDWAGETPLQALADEGLPLHRVNGHHLELAVPPAAKLDVLRRILAESGVEDIDIATPSLETLYAHFSRQASVETAAEGA